MTEPLMHSDDPPEPRPVDQADAERKALEREIEARAAKERGDDGEKELTVTPQPTASHQRLYRVELSEREMQCIANGLTAFFNVCSRDKIMINPLQTEALLTSLGKMKAAIEKGEVRVVTGIDFAELAK